MEGEEGMGLGLEELGEVEFVWIGDGEEEDEKEKEENEKEKEKEDEETLRTGLLHQQVSLVFSPRFSP